MPASGKRLIEFVAFGGRIHIHQVNDIFVDKLPSVHITKSLLGNCDNNIVLMIKHDWSAHKHIIIFPFRINGIKCNATVSFDCLKMLPVEKHKKGIYVHFFLFL